MPKWLFTMTEMRSNQAAGRRRSDGLDLSRADAEPGVVPRTTAAEPCQGIDEHHQADREQR